MTVRDSIMSAADDSSRPRVFFINRSYWPDVEATGQLLTELGEDLASRFQVTVVAGQPNGNPTDESFKRYGCEVRHGVTICRVRHTRFPQRLLAARIINDLTFLLAVLVAVIRMPRPDIVVTESDPSLLALIGRILQFRGAKLVVYLLDIHPNIALAMGKIRNGPLVRNLQRMLLRVYRGAERVIVPSRDMLQHIRQRGVPARRSFLVPNWIDTDRVRPVKEGNGFRKRHGLNDQFVVMYSGKLGLCQQLEDVLAAADLLRERADIRFLLVGDGALKAKLEQQARRLKLPNLQFLPYVAKEELAESLSAADVHLVPLDPRVAEYLMPCNFYGVLASGTPLIAVAPVQCELSQLTREYRLGAVAPPGEPAVLADVIRRIVDNRWELRAMGRRARLLAEQQYDRRHSVARFAQILNDVVCEAYCDQQTSEEHQQERDTWNQAATLSEVQSRPLRSAAGAGYAFVSSPPLRGVPMLLPNLAERRILVTGGAGFLGSHLCQQMAAAGCRHVFAPRRCEYDLREAREIRTMLAELQPEVVIHLAAVVGGIGANRDNPGRYFYENAIMGIQLLEECRRYGVRKFVGLGTICSYPKFTPVPFQEKDIWNGYPEETNAPYGLAKKMLLVQAQAYRQQYGLNAITLFPVNLYGPGDNFDPRSSHVIPALIRKFVEARDSGAEQIEVWGTGAASREFLYVEDAAEAIALAADRYNRPEPINIGSGQEISIRNLVELLRDLFDFSGTICWDTSKPDSQPRRCLDVTRAAHEFGFRAKTCLGDGLKQTIDWYLDEQVEARAISNLESPAHTEAREQVPAAT